MPESFNPPYGIRSARHWVPQLTWMLPDSTWRTYCMAQLTFSVKMAALRP